MRVASSGEGGAVRSGATRLRVAFRTLGCKVNRAESESIAAELLGSGVSVVAADEADVVVVNTCTVTAEADAKARKAIRQALAAAQAPLVVVTGCMAALDADQIAALGERVVVEADKERVPTLVEELLGLGARAASASAHAALAGLRAGDAFRTRVALKIQDGCDAFCTYCIVPHARGAPRSVPLDEVVAQTSALVAANVREIVLTGVNVGRYFDSARDARLADALRAVAACGVERIRLSSVEPLDVTPELLGVMGATPAFCRHLHVPLQAGNDGVLAAMDRGYSTADFAARLAAARESLPGVVFTTDVIAGFPGETAHEAAETLAFCESVGFSRLHVFRYSPRPGTPAAARTDHVPAAESRRRADALRELSERLEGDHARSRIGQIAEVLVERLDVRSDGTRIAQGTTRDYVRVRFSAGDEGVGDLASVMLRAVEGVHLEGERVGSV